MSPSADSQQGPETWRTLGIQNCLLVVGMGAHGGPGDVPDQKRRGTFRGARGETMDAAFEPPRS
eukprot:9491802-Pyramimonas_sp.AAC.2